MTDINISDFSFPSPVMTIKKVIYLRPRQPVLFVFWHWQEGGEGGLLKKATLWILPLKYCLGKVG